MVVWQRIPCGLSFSSVHALACTFEMYGIVNENDCVETNGVYTIHCDRPRPTLEAPVIDHSPNVGRPSLSSKEM